MAIPNAPSRTFTVHAADDGRHAHRVEGVSFEDAALSFIEHWRPPADADGEISVIVLDDADGREQCYRVDVGTGETRPCA